MQHTNVLSQRRVRLLLVRALELVVLLAVVAAVPVAMISTCARTSIAIGGSSSSDGSCIGTDTEEGALRRTILGTTGLNASSNLNK